MSAYVNRILVYVHTTAGPASKPPVTRTDHERRVSSRLTRGIAADVELPKRIGATAYGTGVGRYRDMPTASGVIGANSLGDSRCLTSKDDIALQRPVRQTKK